MRIHLDDVAGLGEFVGSRRSLPVPAGPRPRVAELRSALGITDDRLVARSYADLLERRGIQLIPRR